MSIFKRKQKKYVEERNVVPIGSLYREPLSSVEQLAYSSPKHLKAANKGCRRRFLDFYRVTNADLNNEGVLNNDIEGIGADDKNDALKEYQSHKSSISRIETAQRIKVYDYEKRIAFINEEIAKIKDENPDLYLTDISYLKKVQRKTMPFYKQVWCLALVVIFSIVLDYCTIHTSIDALLTQNQLLSILLSGCIAALIDVVPAIAGVFMKNKEAENRKLVLALLGFIFFSLFTITFVLRFTTMDSLYEDTSQLFLGSEMEVQPAKHTPAEITMTFLLGFEPLLSSVLSLVFGFISSTEKEKKRNMDEIRLSNLVAEREERLIRIKELEEVIAKQQNLINEEEAYKAQLEEIDIGVANMKGIADLALTEHCKSPEANGHILLQEDLVPFSV